VWWATLLLHPHAVIIPGDMLDEGKHCDDAHHVQLLKRFEAAFRAHKDKNWRLTVPFSTRSIPLILTAGNHDQPPPPASSAHGIDAARVRNKAAFGGDSCTCVRGHVIHTIDTSGLLYDGEGEQGAGWSACEGLSCGQHGHHIVVTHTPLFRHSDSVCGQERGRGGGVTYLDRDAALVQGQDVLAQLDSALLMQTANSAANATGRYVSVVLSGHTHAPCFITYPTRTNGDGANRSMLHATLSASGWRMRPDASCALLLLQQRAEEGSVIFQLPLPHEHLCIAVVVAACVAVVAVVFSTGRGAWRSLRWRHKSN
jgi:hypothetical protein